MPLEDSSVATVFFLGLLFAATSQERCRDDAACVQMKTHGLWSADCYRREFRKFPQCLRSDVEVIDLSYNRLRQISKDDLARYSGIKYLYLSDNTLTNLKNSTFEGLNNLISLDLSLNGITKLPHQIFHLPSLKRLYLSQNQNINVVETVKEIVPISSPLEALDISFNDLETLPLFGIMPHLTLYNISGNNLANMELKHVAGLCGLKVLANANFTANFGVPCDCWNIQKWLREKSVTFTKIDCDIEENDCPYTISEVDQELYAGCLQRTSQIEFNSILAKVIIGGAAAVLIVAVSVIGYVLYKRKKRRAEKVKTRKEMEVYAEKLGKDSEGLLIN